MVFYKVFVSGNATVRAILPLQVCLLFFTKCYFFFLIVVIHSV